MLSVNAGSGDVELMITPAAGSQIAWWTVRVLAGDAWRTWILPGVQTRLVVAAAGETRSLRALVTGVDRFGAESAVRDATVFR